MASLEVSKKVSLLGSWNEDIFSDEIVQSIAARAKLEKGKKVKVMLNETGIKLTRSRFFQESKSTFFPIKDLKTVTRSPEVSHCILFILSDPEKKYKIIALRCASQDDMVHLINISTDIQRKSQSTNMELRKKDNDNWTLRERRIDKTTRTVMDVFSNHKPNGEVPVKINGNVTHRQEFADHLDSTSANNNKGVYIKRPNAGGSSSYRLPRKRADVKNDHRSDDNYVIETEVMSHPQTVMSRPQTVMSRPQTGMSHPQTVMSQPKTVISHTQTVSPDHSRQNSEELKRSGTRARHSSLKDRTNSSRHQDSSRPQIYSGQNIVPSRSVVYTTMSRAPVASRPVVYREPPRIYHARIEPSTVFYRNPFVPHARAAMQPELVPATHTRAAMQPEHVPITVLGETWSGRYDQRSIRSNTSKLSQTHKKRSSESHYPTTIVRSIEDTYPRPAYIYRPRTDQIIGIRPRPSTYHGRGPNELRMYPDDGTPL